MNKKETIPGFEGLTEEEYAMVAKLQQQISELETEHEQSQKTIAGLSARQAYLDEIKEEYERFFKRKSLL
ncbi:MAG: hypothetical protein ACHQIM_03250 [Sphingobacteriales bacterium]